MKKIFKYSNSIFHLGLELASNHICCVVFIILLLLINYDRIIAEVTTPIRCAMASDTTKVLMSVGEWKKQKGIETLRPIKDADESMRLFTPNYNLTSLEKKLIPQTIKINNRVYELNSVNLKTKIATYFSEQNYLNIFITYYFVMYDLELQKTILSAEKVVGQYWTLFGPGSNEVECDKNSSQEYSMKVMQYNF
ncbi:hypothetical protein QV08_03305 [Gallibacterium salpingitidis]|uniref:Uncharacterized protein n=1 Tax=Gallibacterium salpingitidis TaxID=505341 RepID=A0AB36E569_9PAST|nr:hypothetical protein [Gallibacterium salpingitidis]OBX08841.1 hypothetical protein QV08_03305 [Gallibacterium salpingitidis]OBX10252.1 hypothetical protein QV09_06160 [Gallibacterium salpingitidis]WKT00934.1 hypothetical protein NYR30_06595 [Gallibacterium salpingitidis]